MVCTGRFTKKGSLALPALMLEPDKRLTLTVKAYRLTRRRDVTKHRD